MSTRSYASLTSAPADGRKAGGEAERAATLLAFVERLAAALLAHDRATARLLLAQPAAARLPREVREEALAFQTLPPASARAPMRTLRLAYRLQQASQRSAGPAGEQLDLFAQRRQR